MNPSALEAISRISSPLAVAGLALVVLALVFDRLLKMRIFPTVTKQHTYDLLNRIITGMFIIAVVAIVLGVLGYIAPRPAESQSPGTNLKGPLVQDSQDCATNVAGSGNTSKVDCSNKEKSK